MTTIGCGGLGSPAAMYLAAAFALVRLEAWLKTTRLQEHSQTVTWCAVFLLALWQNADAFGFISPTFHFYFANHGTWLDHR